MSEVFGIKIAMTPWVIIPLLLLATVILAFLLNIVILKFLHRVVEKTAIRFDDRVYSLLQKYLFPLLVVMGLFLIVDAVPLPRKASELLDRLLLLSGLVLVIFFLTKAVMVILRNMEARYEAVGNIKGPVELLTKIVFFAVGGMIILDNLGVSLTPILTTLGVGSLAVAIALQDTLGNFFAGLYLKADQPIRDGHFVRLEGGEEGYVMRIGWRSTRIRMLPNNMVIVPNSRLVQSIVTNYYLPAPELAVLVQAGVHYKSDLEAVERITCEVGRELMDTLPGGVPGFQPFIRYHTFSDFSINFTVILRAREFVDHFLVKHEFIKKLHARYKDEGIVIPFPIRTIHYEEDEKGEQIERGMAPQT